MVHRLRYKECTVRQMEVEVFCGVLSGSRVMQGRKCCTRPSKRVAYTGLCGNDATGVGDVDATGHHVGQSLLTKSYRARRPQQRKQLPAPRTTIYLRLTVPGPHIPWDPSPAP